DDPAGLHGSDRDAPSLPVFVAGRLSGPGVEAGPVTLAVSVAGRIRAVTRTYDDGTSAGRFTALIPPRALAAGSTDVEVLAVTATGSATLLERLDAG
nr:hypothetical protein [Euzebyales bacterium]